MTTNRNDPESLHEILFWNPWSTNDFLAELSGLSVRTVRERLAADDTVEKIEAPSEFGRKRNTVYALTRCQQIRLFDRNMSPAFMAEALMMGFSRLRKGRDIIRVLHHNGLKMPWVISPWRPFKRGSLFDALVKVENLHGGQMLIAVVGHHSELNFIGVEHLVRVWLKWRQKDGRLPAALLFWDPGFNVGEARFLRSFCVNENGDVVCFYPFSRHTADRWIYLNDQNFYPVAIPPWERGVSLSPQKSSAVGIDRLHADIRIQRYPYAERLDIWLAQNAAGAAGITADFLDMSNREIEMFRWLMLFPALDRQTFVEMVVSPIGGGIEGCDRASQQRAFNQRLRKLLSRGYATEIDHFPGHYALTPKGMRFYSMLTGLEAKAMAMSWGHPDRIGKFSFQQEHQARIWKLIKGIAREGILMRAGTDSNRLIFYDIQRVSVEIPKIEIRPDAIITIRIGDLKYQTFWVEVDRGTRKGQKIRWKIEKLFHVFYAHINPSPIEPVLYIVDCESGKNENRVRYILKLLQRLYGFFPRTPLRFLITSTDLLDEFNGTFLDQPIWREFYLGGVDKRLRSLGEILEGFA